MNACQWDPGIFGAYLIGVELLGVDAGSYISRLESSVEFRESVLQSIVKSSLFGMLPLLVVPGAGSEIYRGMAAAIVGGMAVSTLFTLLLLPSLLQLAPRMGEARATSGAMATD